MIILKDFLKMNSIVLLCFVLIPVEPVKAEYINIGTFKITHYCKCRKCSGHWGTQTASGKKAKVKRTIAVDPKIIPLGSKVKIDGKVYIAEDVGGLVKGRVIDIYVKDHKTTIKKGVKYKKVKIWHKKKFSKTKSKIG